MPTKDFREFTFTNETAARNAAASILIPEGFDQGRTVGKAMLGAADKIKPTAAMLAAQRREDTGDWVVSVEESNVERRAALAPLAVSD